MSGNSLKSLKVAIIHDVFIMKGGAERVVDEFIKIFPEADLYTSFFSEDTRFSHIKNKIKKTISRNFFINQYTVFSKIFINNYWESLDLSRYDVVISSSDEFSSKSVITGPATLHICYCYTPPRYLYPEYPNILSIKSIFPAKRKVILTFLRIQDFLAGQRPDRIIAISKTVKARINKYYRREAVVIYPPVNIPATPPQRRMVSNYFIYVGALVQRKGVDLAVEVFNRIGDKLVIIGDGRDRDKLQAKAKQNVVFKGYVNESEKVKYLKSARGFVFPSIDEDFGIAPIEAMSYGVPVIAYYSGGLRETVIEGKTGVFFRQHSTDSFIDAINRFNKIKFNPNTCYEQSRKYSEKRFRTEFSGYIKKEYEKFKKQNKI